MRAAIISLGLLAMFQSSPSLGGSLDGSYISNKNNLMEISGSRYVYIPRDGTTNPKNVRSTGTVRNVGANKYRFTGHLNYVCTQTGTTLDCGNRVWTRR